MKAGKIVKITVSVIVLGGLAAAGNYFIANGLFLDPEFPVDHVWL